jgi:hypothetical protein
MIERPDWNVDPPSLPSAPATTTAVAVVEGGRDWSPTPPGGREADDAKHAEWRDTHRTPRAAPGGFTVEDLALVAPADDAEDGDDWEQAEDSDLDELDEEAEADDLDVDPSAEDVDDVEEDVARPPAQQGATARRDRDQLDESALYRKLLVDGVFSPAELAKHYGLSTEELDALTKPPVTRQSVNQELARIDKFRRENRIAYNKDYKMQARERELLEAQNKIPAKAVEAAKSASQPHQSNAPGLDPALLESWDKQGGGVEYHLEVAHRTAQAVMDVMDEEEAEQFQQSFDQLDQSVQTEVFRFLAIDGAGAARPATDAELEVFASTEEGSALEQEWGSRAARNLGTARARIDLMLGSMSDADRKAASEWFEALPSSQAKAVLQALAR